MPFFIVSEDAYDNQTKVSYKDLQTGCSSVMEFKISVILDSPDLSYSSYGTWNNNIFCEGDSISVSIHTDRANEIL